MKKMKKMKKNDVRGKMKKGFLCGAMGITMAAMLAGCGGGSDADKNTGDSGKTGYSQEAADVNDDSDKDANDTGSVADDSMGAGVLRHDITDKDVLDAPTGATLFADKLTLPIKIDDLMDYPLTGVGIEGINTLSSLIDTYTESSNNFSFIVYDKTGENRLYLPDLVLGDEDSENELTIKQAVTDGNWMMGPSKVYYDTLGLTEEEYNTLCNDNPDSDGEYLLLDKLYEEFGTPNYIGWFCDQDNATMYGGNYDAKEFIDKMRHPENYGSDKVTAYEYCVGWQFADYAVALDLCETSDAYSGNTKGSISNINISYIPASYGTIEDVCGLNAVKEFMAAR